MRRVLGVFVAVALVALSGCAAALLGGAASSGARPSAPQGRSAVRDDAISAAVRAKLAAEPALAGLELRVLTYNGVVTLRGEVRRAEQRAAAERAARSATGVKSVRNELLVRGG